jgi:hypothetical protein
MSQAEQETPKVTVSEETEHKACPRCGWTDAPVPKASDEDKQEYLRCVMGNRAFSKTYPLYDGAVNITFQSLDSEAVQAVNKVLMQIDSPSPEVADDLNIKLKLIYFTKKYSTAEIVTEYETPVIETPADIDTEFSKRFPYMEPVLRVITQSYMIFTQLQELLVAEAFDENFWKGAGPH